MKGKPNDTTEKGKHQTTDKTEKKKRRKEDIIEGTMQERKTEEKVTQVKKERKRIMIEGMDGTKKKKTRETFRCIAGRKGKENPPFPG